MNESRQNGELAAEVWRWLASDADFARFALEAPDGVLVVDANWPDRVFFSPALAARLRAHELDASSRGALSGDEGVTVVRFVAAAAVSSATASRFEGVSPESPSLRAWGVRLFEGGRSLAIPLETKRWIETLPHFVWTCMPDGRCDYLSPQWVAYTGKPESEQLGYAWLEQLHPDDREITNARWAEAAAHSDTFDTEFRLRRHDGVYRWFKTRAVAMRDDDGELVRWVGSNTDVQELHEARVRLEERVDERTRELRAAFEGLEVAQRVGKLGSWSLDVATGAVQWTAELFRILGRDPSDEPPNYQVQESLFAPESWVRLQAAIAHSVATGEGYELELTALRPDGERRIAMARATSRMEDGKVTHLFGTFHDVTELAEARLAATRAAERARLAREAMGLGLWDYDVVTGTTVWDERMYALYGMSPDLPIDYERWQERVVEEDRDLLAQAWALAIERTGEFDVDFRIRRDGEHEVRTLHGVARLVRAPDGSPLRLVGLNHDVTEVRAHEVAAQARNALVEQFVRDTPAAIAMFDSRLRVQITSRRFRACFGLDDEATGAPLEDVFTEAERWRAILGTALTGEVVQGEGEAFEIADGRLEWLTWEARPWQGERRGVTLFTRVVTEQRMLRAQLERVAEDLRRSNQDLEQFAYAASHDLQEPLRAVSGCAQVLQSQYRGTLDEQADELLHHMVDGAERMRALITGLLAYSRVTSRGRAPERFPARDAIDHAMANLQVALDECDAEVVVGALPDVEADRSQLTTLFQNLVSNALKYRRGQKVHVWVDAVDGGDDWVFSVRDDGIGIEPRYHRRIFELFQRLHTRTDYPGTGIGLALCAKIVERHGGRMWVDSAFGVGSTFCFALPKHAAADGGATG